MGFKFRRMKKILIGLFAVVFLSLYSCEMLLPCLEGDGDVQTEERLGGAFSGVENETEIDVSIEYGSNSSVEVTIDKNLLTYIETSVSNGKLVIRSTHDGCMQASEETSIVVRCPNLTNVSLLGTGNIEVSDFSPQYFSATHAGTGDIVIRNLSVAEDLSVNLVGSGNVWFKGRANMANYVLEGSGNIDAEAMRVVDCSIRLEGSGNIHAYVYNNLKIKLSGSGDVNYYGEPLAVVIDNTGSGDVYNRSY